MVENLLNNILLLHGKVGAPRKRPVTLQADAGYDTTAVSINSGYFFENAETSPEYLAV
jgi:hypothetical protein